MKPRKKASRILKENHVIVGAPVIIRNSKGEILLGKRADDNYFYPSYWNLPGGRIDYGEKIQDSAKREVKEEIGVDINIIKRAKAIYEHFPNKNCYLHTVDIPHYAKIVRGVPKPKDETSEVKWFKPTQIKKMKLAYSHKEILKGEGII